MKNKGFRKSLENFEKEVSKQVNKMIESHASQTFSHLSDQDKAFLRCIFMAGFAMGENRPSN